MEKSLKRLVTNTIDLYYAHGVDPNLAENAGAIDVELLDIIK
ncbi:aryl-alcohol dehydrogenase-like predicted oxidoreductase [Sphingobacterium sp. 2149]|nr:aryl-alcohol dehydrogenase-like predicted oxidoreductase [Sphingobacterium sp. 2149]